MKTEQMLEKYLLTHPDFWEFEDEVEEVRRLESLVQKEKAFTHFNARKLKQVDNTFGLAS